MASAKKRAIDIIRKNGGLIRTQEAFTCGIHRRTFYGMRNDGTLIRISRGIYQLADMEISDTSVFDRLFELILGMPEDEQAALLRQLEEKGSKGKRKHFRKPFLVVVDYASGDRAYRDFIQNISRGGVFIETRMPFSVGQEVSLTFALPYYQKHIKIAGKVARASDQGIGVTFRMVDRNQEAMIESLLEMI